ncbi:MAG TPA: serine/threonine-protein kinase, partial [Gemmataceae bacterium]|nr:serine/threonine-protein kinase [Gemmataceae bacterium]
MSGTAVKLAPATEVAAVNPRSFLSRVVPILSRSNDLFLEQLAMTATTVDRAFAVVLVLEWVVGVALALVVSPLAWEGAKSAIHIHVWAALLLGGIIALPPAILAWLRSGQVWTRHLIAGSQMLMAALYIHLTGGRIETHFMIFGSLAFLAAYRDWKVLITASVVVAIDHLLRGWLFPRSVFGVDSASIWRTFEHVWWVVFEDMFLILMILRSNRVQQTVALNKLGEMGQYLLKERLGGGGMGEVFLAEHRLLKRSCAIKLIRPDMARQANTLDRFKREVQITAMLRHPNTVAIYDYGDLEDGTFFYVMEHLPGLSLQQLVEQHGPVPPGRAIYLLRQICGALSEAHSIGLVHRDVKPDNVLVGCLGGQHDVAKLFDFGLVRTVEDEGPTSRLTKAGSVLGTPSYMSPEQVMGEPIDQRSDLFSLGVVAYFLLTGKLPFEGTNSLAVMYARLKDSVPPPTLHCPNLPRDLE